MPKITEAHYETEATESGYVIGYQNGVFARWPATMLNAGKWYSGVGIPDADLGTGGDWYLSTTLGIAYEKVSAAWVERITLKGGYWFFGTTVPASDLGVVGDSYLNTSALDVYTKTVNGWELASNISGLQSRTTVVINAGTVASGNTAIGVAEIFKCALFIKVSVSAPCRLRIYATEAFRGNDISRPATTPILAGAQTGIILDIVLDSTTGLEWYLSPPAYGANGDTVTTTNLYWAIQNTGSNSVAISAELTCIQVER